MKILLIVFIFVLISCGGSRSYKGTMDYYIGKRISIVVYSKVNLISTTKYKKYDEYQMKFISPFSKTQGVCTTIFKVRKSDTTIVSWHSKGEKSDCVWRNQTSSFKKFWDDITK